MRLQLAPTSVSASYAGSTATLADLDGDGLDDETGEPVATDDQDGDGKPEDDFPASAEHRWLLMREGVQTGDGRLIQSGVTTWRELPLPFMATDVTDDAHDGAILVANIVEIVRDGDDLYGVTRHIVSNDPRVLQLQTLIDQGDLRGVSVDLDNLAGNLILEMAPEEELADPEIEETANTVVIPFGGDTERLEVTACRIMGATAVPFPAFAEAQQLRASLVAGAMTLDTEQQSESSLKSPVIPPRAWFDNPRLSTPTPITVTADGRLFGHIALWNSCHRGMSECTPPPRNRSGNYDHFHTGTLRVEDGGTVRVGHITVDGGHANERLGIQAAKQHYDETGWTAADCSIGEDDWGIYAAGAIVPDLDDLRIRKLMSHDVSGDWRAFNGVLELISVRTVPVPGFVKTVYASGEVTAMIASMPVCEADIDPAVLRVADRIAASIGRTREQIQADRDNLAFRLGRHPSQVRAAIAARVRSV